MKSTVLTMILVWSALPATGQFELPAEWKPQDTTKGSTALRKDEQTYLRNIEFVQPAPSTTAAQFTAINPNLPKILPDFEKLMESAEISSRFKELYGRKISNLKKGSLLTPHNYFDCETVLRLQHPSSGRKVLLLQADMDVVTDGSDPVRAPKLDDYDLARSSDWYLPETAYSWSKSEEMPNPFLAYYPETLEKLQKLRQQLEVNAKEDPGVVWREMIRTCDAQIYRIKARGLSDGTKTNLRNRRFLLATRDPFVVLPVPWVNKSAAWSPKMGDYAAVVHANKIYPAILGDAGPTYKVGEASLRMARALNPKADGRTRAVSDLSVTYLFFPKTRGKAQEPNLETWHDQVTALLKEIGGLGKGFALHDWNSEP